jgi:aquaporin Z
MAREDRGYSRYIAEFIGTFILTIAVGCNTLNNAYIWGATSNACTLMVLIFAFGDVSGGHFNPAVTIAAFIAQGISMGEMMTYIFFQLLAAALGSVVYVCTFLQSFNIAPMPGFAWQQAALAETVYTMMLCFVVLSCAYSIRSSSASKPEGPQFAPVAIGFVLIAGAYGGGAISGGCFNPAIALAVDASSAGLGFGWSIAYIGYQLIGAALAGVFHRLTRPDLYQAKDPIIRNAIGGPTKLSMLISEFLGTFILTITVGLNVLAASRAGAWSIGAALMCMIYALGDVSGGNFNPAVTLAVFAAEPEVRNPPKTALYMATQLLAGIMGAWMFVGMISQQGWETFSLGPVGKYTWATRAPIEIFFTFVLCLTVLSVACVKARKPADEFDALAIGATISVGGYVAGMASGGTLNPAVTLGVASTSVLCPHCMSFIFSFVYMFLEFLGALLAVAVFKVCRPEEYGGLLRTSTKEDVLPQESRRTQQGPPSMISATAPPSGAMMQQPYSNAPSPYQPAGSFGAAPMPMQSQQMPMSGSFTQGQPGTNSMPYLNAHPGAPQTIPSMGFSNQPGAMVPSMQGAPMIQSQRF